MATVMHRIKVVNEISDLVPILRAVDTPVKLKLLRKLTETWVTGDDVLKEFGKDGAKALQLFEKLKLVDTRWVSREGKRAPEKSFHSYYSTINISTTAPLAEVSEILAITSMPDKEYAKLEAKIHAAVGDTGRFFSDVAEELKMSGTELKGLVKRSDKLEYRGHRIERLNASRAS